MNDEENTPDTDGVPREQPPSSPDSTSESASAGYAPEETSFPTDTPSEPIAALGATTPVPPAPEAINPPTFDATAPMSAAEPGSETPSAPIGDGEPPQFSVSRAVFVTLIVVLVLSMIAAAWGWVLWSRESTRADDLEAEVDDLNAQVEDLERQIAELDSGSGSGGLEDLFGGDTDLGDLGDLGDLLGSLLDGADTGDLDELSDLFSGLLDGPDAGDLGDLGDLGDAFGDLFGGGEGDSGALGDLFGEDGLGSLGDMFGGLLGDEGSQAGAGMFGIGGPQAVLRCTDASAVGEADIPDDDAQVQYDAVVAWVEDARGLDFDEVPEPTYLTFDEIDERIRADLEDNDDPQTSEQDSQLLAALGVLPAGTDLAELTEDFVGDGQVAGFYDPETGELVVGTDNPDEPLSGTDLISLAHELDHALTDQALGLPDDEIISEDPDAWFAQTTLVEGDATLLMNDFTLATVDFTDLLGSLDLGALDAQASAEGVPHYLQRQLLFPYLQGLEFACALRSDGGWPATDAAYDELPTTSAQTMWPERYLAGEVAVEVADVGDPGGGWDETRTVTFGAADLMFLFEAPGDDTGAALDSPAERAAAWAGGVVTQFASGDESAFGISLAQRDGERPLCDSMTDWYTAAFPGAESDGETGAFSAQGPDQAAVISCSDESVVVGIAPDLDTARSIAG